MSEKKEPAAKSEPIEVKPVNTAIPDQPVQTTPTFGEPTLTDCLRYVELQMQMAARGMLPEPAAKEVDRMLLAAQRHLAKL